MDRLSRRTFVRLAGVSAAVLGAPSLRANAAPAPLSPAPAVGLAQVTPPLDPQMQAVIDELVALEAPKLTEMNPFNARQTSPLTLAVQAILTKQGKPPLEPVANVAHRLIPGGAGQQLLVRFYQPAGNGPFPTLLYFHGGGWVIANLDVYDASCRALVNAANCAVVSVAYRQAPENPFPAAPEDAFAAYQWLRQNAALVRTDPNRIAVGGESAGGNLAAVTALIARDRGAPLPVHQLLVYPVAQINGSYPSITEFAGALPLGGADLPVFYNNYAPRTTDAQNPYASPILANLAGMPAATVITAEVDPLRDEGEAFANKLRAAGVTTTLTRYSGVTHEFFSMGAVVDKAKEAVAEAAAGLKQAFGG